MTGAVGSALGGAGSVTGGPVGFGTVGVGVGVGSVGDGGGTGSVGRAVVGSASSEGVLDVGPVCPVPGAGASGRGELVVGVRGSAGTCLGKLLVGPLVAVGAPTSAALDELLAESVSARGARPLDPLWDPVRAAVPGDVVGAGAVTGVASPASTRPRSRASSRSSA